MLELPPTHKHTHTLHTTHTLDIHTLHTHTLHTHFTRHKRHKHGFWVGDRSKPVVPSYSITSSHMHRPSSTGHCCPHTIDMPWTVISFQLHTNCCKSETFNCTFSPEDRQTSTVSKSHTRTEGGRRKPGMAVHICCPTHSLP